MDGVIERQFLSLRQIRRSRKRPMKTAYSALYLTPKNDPRNSIVVTYHQDKSDEPASVSYRQSGENTSWTKIESNDVRDFQNENINICHTELKELKPDTEYEFIVGETKAINAVRHKFKTAPENIENGVKVAFGADPHAPSNRFRIMTSIVSEFDPHFFVIGGDWCEDGGNLENSYKWVEFWEGMWEQFIDSKGRIVPLIPVIGNHEIGPGDMENLFFEDMFAFPDEGKNNYGVIDVGDYMSLVALDTASVERYRTAPSGNPQWGAVAPTPGTQLSWLESILSARSNVDFVIPVHHIPFFPTHRNHLSEASDFDVNAWLECFKEYGIRMMFSGHDHAYKKTHGIKFDKADQQAKISQENGFIEFGDGGLGTKSYSGNLQDEWYIDEFGTGFSHVSLVTFEMGKATVVTKNHLNETINETEINM